MEQELALRPFVPSKDLAVSQKFYQALGFVTTLADEIIAIMKLGGHSFILQNFYKPELAENFMLQLMVRNVDLWWAEHVEPAKLVEMFGVKPPRAPAMQPWGLKVGFLSDPTGVLWHIAESLF